MLSFAQFSFTKNDRLYYNDTTLRWGTDEAPVFFGWSRAKGRKKKGAFGAESPPLVRVGMDRRYSCKNAVNSTPVSVLDMAQRMPWWSKMVFVMYSPSPLPPLFRLRDFSTR